MNKIFLIPNPVFIVRNDEEYKRCKVASDLLIKTISPFKYDGDKDDDELTPWERYEQRSENEDDEEEPDDMPFTIHEQFCECHGTRYLIKFRYSFPFQFKNTVDDLIIGNSGCSFNINSTFFIVVTEKTEQL
jgi:hypothetical protein